MGLINNLINRRKLKEFEKATTEISIKSLPCLFAGQEIAMHEKDVAEGRVDPLYKNEVDYNIVKNFKALTTILPVMMCDINKLDFDIREAYIKGKFSDKHLRRLAVLKTEIVSMDEKVAKLLKMQKVKAEITNKIEDGTVLLRYGLDLY